MKRLSHRLTAWALVLALLAVLSPAPGRAALEGVYFTAANDELLDLASDTMPFYSDGLLYVSSRLFEKRDLGVTYGRNNNLGLAMLYTTRTDLRFDLVNQIVFDKQGKRFSGHAIERGGVVFFPLDLVCTYFGLNYSINETETAPLIRVRSASAILDDESFINAAASMMRDRYAEYERSLAESPGPNPPPEIPHIVQAAEGQKIYLIFDSQSAEDTLALLETLEGVQATFLLTVEELADGDLLRALVAGGHAVALRLAGETAEDAAWELEQGRALAWQSACIWLELAWCGERTELEGPLAEMGCLPVRGELAWTEGLGRTSQVTSLMRSVGRYREDLSVFLDAAGGSLESLPALLDALEEGGYRVCAWRLTA